MLKKIIGLTGAILLSTSVLAEKNSFFFKLDIGSSKMNNAIQHNIYPKRHIYLPDNKSKSKISPTLSVAAGFYLNDYIRQDLNFGYQKVNFEKSVVDCSWYDIRNGNIMDHNGKFVVNREASIYSLMLDSYIDLPINQNFVLFVGTGIGVARINEEGKLIVTVNKVDIPSNKMESKKEYNFAYSLTTGISYKVANNLNFELSYKWSDYGKSKFEHKNVTRNRYRGHSVLTGVRYSI